MVVICYTSDTTEYDRRTPDLTNEPLPILGTNSIVIAPLYNSSNLPPVEVAAVNNHAAGL